MRYRKSLSPKDGKVKVERRETRVTEQTSDGQSRATTTRPAAYLQGGLVRQIQILGAFRAFPLPSNGYFKVDAIVDRPFMIMCGKAHHEWSKLFIFYNLLPLGSKGG